VTNCGHGASRYHVAVLSALQERVAGVVVSLPEADGLAVAGGAALVASGVVDRATRDLDFFGASGDDVDRLRPAVERALIAAGLEVSREREAYGFVRLIVTDGDDSTEVDLAADARIRPAASGPLGPMCRSRNSPPTSSWHCSTGPKPETSSTSAR
jgi:hypothetical protein